MRLIPVPSEDLDEWKDKIGWHLESFSANGVYSPDDFLADIRNRDRQLWIVEDKGDVICVLLTAISEDRLKTCLVTHLAGKDCFAWLHLMEAVEDWARDIGCKRIEAKTRPGWEKILGRAFDLKKTHVVLEKRL